MVYEYCATELFNEITLHVMKQFSLGTQLIQIIKVIVHLNGPQTTILRLLGRECENYYGLN
jgi:hypothetical protein